MDAIHTHSPREGEREREEASLYIATELYKMRIECCKLSVVGAREDKIPSSLCA